VGAEASAAFVSYCRQDSEFALRLAEDLKSAGARVWIDQLDIQPGEDWDLAIESAVDRTAQMLLILSPASVQSKNVRNEIAVALDANKTIIPVLHQDCAIPLQLRRVQYIDFRTDYGNGLKILLKALDVAPSKQPTAPSSSTTQEGQVAEPLMLAQQLRADLRPEGWLAEQSQVAARPLNHEVKLPGDRAKAFDRDREQQRLRSHPRRTLILFGVLVPRRIAVALIACGTLLGAVAFYRSKRIERPSASLAKKVNVDNTRHHYYIVGLNPNGDDWLALRSEPSFTRGTQIMKMGPDTLMTVVGRDGAWLHVQLTTGEVGWAHSQYLACCK